MPRAESLKDTLERMLPCWQRKIAPDLRSRKNVFVSSHGNTLRALAKYIENISDKDIESFEIPTGIPLIYRLDRDLRPLDRFYLKSDDDCRRLQLDEMASGRQTGAEDKGKRDGCKWPTR